jgi:hypothetical protein
MTRHNTVGLSLEAQPAQRAISVRRVSSSLLLLVDSGITNLSIVLWIAGIIVHFENRYKLGVVPAIELYRGDAEHAEWFSYNLFSALVAEFFLF